MKYIRLFETQAERDAAVIVGPMMVYTKETDTLEVEGITPINIEEHPNLMTKMYEWGWAANPYYMTVKECSVITDAQLSSKKGGSSTNSLFAGCAEDFTAFKYFTSVKTVPSYMFRGCSFTKISFPDSIETIQDYALVGNWIRGTLDLSNTKITILYNLYHQTIGGNANDNIIGIKLPSTCSSMGNGYSAAYAPGTTGRTKNLKWITLPYSGVVSLNRYTGASNAVRYYVPDDLVNVYKTDGTTGDSHWNTIPNNIFPISQWQTDVNNGVIQDI